jgi:hypothetical protein
LNNTSPVIHSPPPYPPSSSSSFFVEYVKIFKGAMASSQRRANSYPEKERDRKQKFRVKKFLDMVGKRLKYNNNIC